MKRFLGYIKEIPRGKKIKYCTILISFVVLFIFLALGSFIKNMLPDLNTYKKWDLDGGYAQIHGYVPERVPVPAGGGSPLGDAFPSGQPQAPEKDPAQCADQRRCVHLFVHQL